MAKDTYYFSHDYDPTGDPKMQAMLGSYGGLGYGIFWRIVEMLHADANHRLPLKKYLYTSIANQMKSDTIFIEKFIMDCLIEFELFICVNEANEALLEANEAQLKRNYFSSNRVFRNIHNKVIKKIEKSEAGKIGGIKSGESRRNKKNNEANEALLEANEPNEAKESKGKEKEIQLCPAMLNIFKREYPDYPADNETDYPSCLQIAYKIAKLMGWTKESVYNGRLDQTLQEWTKIVAFSKNDVWFSTRSITDLNKQFQTVIQKLNSDNFKKTAPKKFVN